MPRNVANNYGGFKGRLRPTGSWTPARRNKRRAVGLKLVRLCGSVYASSAKMQPKRLPGNSDGRNCSAAPNKNDVCSQRLSASFNRQIKSVSFSEYNREDILLVALAQPAIGIINTAVSRRQDGREQGFAGAGGFVFALRPVTSHDRIMFPTPPIHRAKLMGGRNPVDVIIARLQQSKRFPKLA